MIRAYCGFREGQFPVYQVWLNFFHERLTEENLTKIFQLIFKLMIKATGAENFALRIISIDGQLFQSFAKYKGCNRYDCDCENVPIENLAEAGNPLRKKLEEHPEEVKINTPISICLKCPFCKRWEDKKEKNIPKVPFVTVVLQRGDMTTLYPETCPADAPPAVKLVYHLKLEAILNAHQLQLKLVSYPQDALDENQDWKPFSCKRIPSDKSSRMGARASKTDPSKTEFVFGGDVIMATTYLILLGLEMPCAVTVHYGNAHEHESGKQLGEQMKKAWEMGHLGEMVKVTIKDAGWDAQEDYKYFYDESVAAITGINPRRRTHEKIIRDHEIDINTRIPKAKPCGLPMTPNGVEKERGRVCYVCNKACEKRVQNPHPNCPYLNSPLGYSAHFNLTDDLTVFGWIPRGSATEKEVKKYRSGSERMNAFTEKTASQRCPLHSGSALKKWGIFKAIAILLKKVFYFLQRVNTVLKEAYLKNEPWDDIPVRDFTALSGRVLKLIL